MDNDAGRGSTALHEAAHLVLYRRVGIDTGDVSVTPDPQWERLGFAQAGDWWDQEQLEGAVVALLGGWAAEIEFGGADPAATVHGSWMDFEEADELIERFQLEGDREEWNQKALDAVRRNEALIRAVADALLALDGLDMCEVMVLMDGLDSGKETLPEIIESLREAREIEHQLRLGRTTTGGPE